MGTRLTIGDFAQITRLTITTLRHYHRVGLLEPADVDPGTNYRYYRLEQVPIALTIRRYRQLQVPVDGVAALLSSPDEHARDRVLQEHLARMRAQLQETQDAIGALQALLTQPFKDVRVTYREIDPAYAVAESSVIDQRDLVSWWTTAISRLELVRTASGSGNGERPLGGVFDHELFTHGRGRATVFAPIHTPGRGSITVPGGTFAVAVHHGPHATIDLTYAALGSRLTRDGLAGAGPVHEHYLVSARDTADPTRWQTELCWPAAHQLPHAAD